MSGGLSTAQKNCDSGLRHSSSSPGRQLPAAEAAWPPCAAASAASGSSTPSSKAHTKASMSHRAAGTAPGTSCIIAGVGRPLRPRNRRSAADGALHRNSQRNRYAAFAAGPSRQLFSPHHHSRGAAADGLEQAAKSHCSQRCSGSSISLPLCSASPASCWLTASAPGSAH